MTPLEGLSFQLYSARTLEPLKAQFELLAGLGYKKVEAFGGLLNDPQRLKSQLEAHGLSMPSSHVGLDRLRADPLATVRLCRESGRSDDLRSGAAARRTRGWRGRVDRARTRA